MELSEGDTVADLAQMIQIPVDLLLAVALTVVDLVPVGAICEDTADDQAQHIQVLLLEVKDICKEIKKMMETVSETVKEKEEKKEGIEVQEEMADMKTVRKEISNMRQELEEERRLRTLEEKKLHKAVSTLSTLWEVSAKSNCVNFIEQEFPKMKRKYPLAPRRIKYNSEENRLLEDLASKCEKYDFRSRDIPSHAEVDIFVELYERGGDEKKVTGLFLVEVSHSDKLYPNPLYPRPFKSPSTPEKTWSTNLLYKLIQLERGYVAARQCKMPPCEGSCSGFTKFQLCVRVWKRKAAE